MCTPFTRFAFESSKSSERKHLRISFVPVLGGAPRMDWGGVEKPANYRTVLFFGKNRLVQQALQ